MFSRLNRVLRRLTVFVWVMLVVAFLDEFAYSILEAARPLIRDSFTLTYVDISLVTTVPILVAILVEPVVGLYADGPYRRRLMVVGALAFGLGLVVQGLAPAFGWFIVGATLQAPASGVFVNLAQAALMDDAPARRENRMALWTFSGSLAVVVGPLLLSGLLLLGIDWRVPFVVIGLVAVGVALVLALLPANPALRSSQNDEADVDASPPTDDEPLSARLRYAGALLRRPDIWRWLVLLEFSNLMLDVMFGLLALYMVDVVGITPAQAGLAVAVWTGVGLVGDFLLIPLLERVRGLAYLRFSTWVELVLFPLFLLAEPILLKLMLLGAIGLFNAGWYAVLQGNLYDALGDNSGAVLIVGNAAVVFGALIPLALGVVAEQAGLTIAMWLLLAGPLALVVGIPRETTIA
jgi:FSR family fosmidomycin resistance protein-like MFS transporter